MIGLLGVGFDICLEEYDNLLLAVDAVFVMGFALAGFKDNLLFVKDVLVEEIDVLLFVVVVFDLEGEDSPLEVDITGVVLVYENGGLLSIELVRVSGVFDFTGAFLILSSTFAPLSQPSSLIFFPFLGT